MSDAALSRRGECSPAHESMPRRCRSSTRIRYFLTTRTDCAAADGACAPGCAALKQLMAAMELALPLAGDELELSGTIEVTDCAAASGAVCLLAWQADAEGLSLLGAAGEHDDPGLALVRARHTLAAPALFHAERAPALLT